MMEKDMGAIPGSREPDHTSGSGLVGFDPSRVGDLPEKLFVHSLELVPDDEDAEPPALFAEVQRAAELLAEIRSALR
jgi:hypothetical protein